ncbi:hypothetical protein LDO48_03155 [Pantoea agglomerans]|nr:hypothetical protein [Pantoea agglomerans]
MASFASLRKAYARLSLFAILTPQPKALFWSLFFISTQLQAALLAGQRALSGYSSSFSVISLNLFSFWRYLQ